MAVATEVQASTIAIAMESGEGVIIAAALASIIGVMVAIVRLVCELRYRPTDRRRPRLKPAPIWRKQQWSNKVASPRPLPETRNVPQWVENQRIDNTWAGTAAPPTAPYADPTAAPNEWWKTDPDRRASDDGAAPSHFRPKWWRVRSRA